MQAATINTDIQQHLLQQDDLQLKDLQQILDQSISQGADYADLFLQTTQSETWQIEQGQLRHGSFEEDAGFGLRAIQGEKTAFAFSDGCSKQQLNQAVSVISQIATQGQDKSIAVPSDRAATITPLYQPVNPIIELAVDEKQAYLHLMDKTIRQKEPHIVDVQCSLSADYEVMMVLNHQGRMVQDVQPLTAFHVRVVIEKNGKRAIGRKSLGGRVDYQSLLKDLNIDQFADKVLHQAYMNLQAAPPPGGVMPVVLGPGWPAVLLHEAIGHGLEGDHIRRNASVFANAIGERVASDQCTIVDDATINNARGSISVDDEGEVGQRTVLIENGIVKGFMQDKHNALLMGEQSTGNCRRESYAHRPLVRMTNTFMLPGKYDPEEIIASVDKGIYCVDFAGGEVDITSGQFVFSTSEAYLIENGKITTPISATTLIGDGLNVLKQVSMVGNDLRLDNGQGVCGKDGQSVPVGVGQPTLRIDGLMVGGVG